MPGLTESFPLLVFGAACLALSIYAFTTRGQMFGGRVPVWAYLLGLGAIAVVGGLISSTVGEDLEDLPKEGDRLGSDLIVVPLREWTALQDGRRASPAPRASTPRSLDPGLRRPVHRFPDRAAAPVRALPPAEAAVAVRRPSRSAAYDESDAREDWWHDALQRSGANPEDPSAWSPVDRSQANDVRDVLDSLDSIHADLGRAPPRPRASPTPTPAPAPKKALPRSPRPPSLAPPPELEADLAELARELDRLTAEPLGPVVPAPEARRSTPSSAATCVGCDHPLGRAPRGPPCESCGRPLCASCRTKAERARHAGLCPMCSMLLDGSELT